MNRTIATRLLIAGLLVLAGGLVWAGDFDEAQALPSRTTLVNEIELTPTVYGIEVEAVGRALIQEADGWQLLAVDMKCTEPDGSTYVVIVNDGQRKFVAGTISMFLGSGQLKLQYLPDSRTHLMPRAMDIKELYILDVKDDEPMLKGWFQTPRYAKPLARK